MSLSWYLILTRVLFVIGTVAVLVRRSAIISLMEAELILNSANLVFVTFVWILGDMDGEVMAFFVTIVAATKVVVGLAIIVSIFKSRSTASVGDVNLLRN